MILSEVFFKVDTEQEYKFVPYLLSFVKTRDEVEKLKVGSVPSFLLVVIKVLSRDRQRGNDKDKT
jgi:hypothetical protein